MLFEFSILETNLVQVSVDADTYEEAREIALSMRYIAGDRLELGAEILNEKQELIG